MLIRQASLFMNSEILKNYYKSNVLSDNFDFESFAMDVFHFQYTSNDVYKRFIDILGFKTNKIVNVSDIPYMPVSFGILPSQFRDLFQLFLW